MATNQLLDIEIITPQKIVLTGKAVSVSLPGSLCPFQVLYNHAPIVSSLDNGIIKIIDENQNKSLYATSSGFVEVRSNKVAILVESAIDTSTINIQNEKENLANAIELLKNAEDDNHRDEINRKIKDIENKIKIKEKLKE